jgi:hypothetical protein
LEITLDVDAGKWREAVDNWQALAYLEGVRANYEAAQVVQRHARSLLARYHHRPNTRTPSPPGQPPAMIIGRLSASVVVSHDGDDAIVGPTRWASSSNGPYGRFLELGGEHVAHNPTGLMWWHEDGFKHSAHELEKGPRAYMKPATEKAIESGEVTEAYWRRWLVAQQAATA